MRAKAAVRAELSAWKVGDTTVDPGEVLLRLVTQSASRAALYADLLEQQYAKAESGDSESTDLPRGVSALIGWKYSLDKDGNRVAVEEAIRGLVELEGQERDRCASFAAKAVAAGLAERQVRLAENQGKLIANVLQAVLDDPGLGLDERQRSAVPGLIRARLAIAATA